MNSFSFPSSRNTCPNEKLWYNAIERVIDAFLRSLIECKLSNFYIGTTVPALWNMLRGPVGLSSRVDPGGMRSKFPRFTKADSVGKVKLNSWFSIPVKK